MELEKRHVYPLVDDDLIERTIPLNKRHMSHALLDCIHTLVNTRFEAHFCDELAVLSHCIIILYFHSPYKLLHCYQHMKNVEKTFSLLKEMQADFWKAVCTAKAYADIMGRLFGDSLYCKN